MNTLESIAYVASLLIKLVRYALYVFSVIFIIVFLVNIKGMLLYLCSLNLSFYIDKYNLMPIISGIIAGLITLSAMVYVDNLNKKRNFYQKAAEKEYDLNEKYLELLKKLSDKLTYIAYASSEDKMCGIYVQAKPVELLKELSSLCYDIFELHQEREVFFDFIKMDIYTEWLYIYKYLSRGCDLAIEKIEKGELQIIYSDSGSFRCPKLGEVICSKCIHSFDKIVKMIDKEIMNQRKIYQKHK